MRNYQGKTDKELETDVLAELRYEPSVKGRDIQVAAKDGTVTLNGCVASFSEKWDAMRATKRVAGVNAIADDIEVRLPDSLRRTDIDLATAASQQIAWSANLPPGAVMVTVADGGITLDGEVEWWYQKNAAANAVQFLAGVTSLANQIAITPKLVPGEVETAITAAFKRNALFDAQRVKVETSGNKVVLSGNVRNHYEREEAERAAWAAAGVFSVDNRLVVDWSWDVIK